MVDCSWVHDFTSRNGKWMIPGCNISDSEILVINHISHFTDTDFVGNYFPLFAHAKKHFTVEKISQISHFALIKKLLHIYILPCM